MSDYEYVITEAEKVGLACIESSDGTEMVIVNLAAIERGCLLVTVSGQMHGAGIYPWASMDIEAALALIDVLAE